MKTPLSLAVLALALCAQARAEAADGACAAGGQKDMACGRIGRQDMEEVFKLVLDASGYDNDLDDQRPFGKPRRQPTTAVFKEDQKSLAVFGTPAAALAANTGVNVRENTGELAAASRVFIHVPSIGQIAQTRGEAAFLFMHEMSHLVNHDAERLERHNVEHFDAWCTANPRECASDDALQIYSPIGDRAREQFLRPFEDRADRDARQIIATLRDPKTGQPFGEQAGEESLRSCGEWLRAREIKGHVGQHAPIQARIERLRQDRLASQQRAQQAASGAGAAIENAQNGIKKF